MKYLVDLIREFDNKSNNEFKFISFFEENYQNYCCKKLDELSQKEDGTFVDERVILEKLYRPFTKEKKEMMEENEKNAHQSNFDIKKTIETVANKQRNKISDWVDLHPRWIEDEKLQYEYLTILNKITEPIEDDDKIEKKIIRNIAREVQITDIKKY